MAVGLIGFLFFIVSALLKLLMIAIFANAILSWLFAFDVVNYRNRFVAQIADVLDRIVGPVLSPLRRIIPPLGGMDLTPIIALLIIQGILGYLIPPAYYAATTMVAGF